MVVRMEIFFAVGAAAMFGAGHYMSGTVARTAGPLAVAYWTQYGVVAVAAMLLLTQPFPPSWSFSAITWGRWPPWAASQGPCASTPLSRATFTPCRQGRPR